MHGSRPSAIIFGAGNVGRGFLGQLFTESGYQVVFVDVDRSLLDALNRRGGYPLHLVDNSGCQELWIAPVRALHPDDAAVAAAVAEAAIAATAAGARALDSVARTLAAGLVQRLAGPGAQPLNIIVCENLKDAAQTFHDLVAREIPPHLQGALASQVGFVDTVIGRMVPLLTPDQRAADPAFIVAEPYKELPIDREGLVGPAPHVVGLEACDHFDAYVARKLYIHNLGHAVLAYLGHLHGLTFGYEALDDSAVRPLLEAAWREAQAGIAAAHQVPERWLQAHVDDLRRRFANRALGDTIVRLGRDPLRKLAPADRLVGAARLVEQANLAPEALAWAIAAGFCFDSPEDPIAMRLQESIARQGLPATLLAVSRIDPVEPLGQAVLACHGRLRAGKGGQQ